MIAVGQPLVRLSEVQSQVGSVKMMTTTMSTTEVTGLRKSTLMLGHCYLEQRWYWQQSIASETALFGSYQHMAASKTLYQLTRRGKIVFKGFNRRHKHQNSAQDV